MQTFRGFGRLTNDPQLGMKLVLVTTLSFLSFIVPFVGYILLEGILLASARLWLRGEQRLASIDLDGDQLLEYARLGLYGWVVTLAWSSVLVAMMCTLFAALVVMTLFIASYVSGIDLFTGLKLTAGMALFLPVVAILVGSIAFAPLSYVMGLAMRYASLRVALTGRLAAGFELGEIFAFTWRHLFALFVPTCGLHLVSFASSIVTLLSLGLLGGVSYFVTNVLGQDVVLQAHERDIAAGRPTLVG